MGHESQRLRPQRRPAWLSRVLLESALIVLSVLLALVLDEWRRDRHQRAELVLAVQGIRAELAQNRSTVERARVRHLAMHDSLLHYTRVAEKPPPRIYYGGLFNPAPVFSIAWQSAREGGSLNRLPFELRLVLAEVYDRQLQYRELGDAIIQSAMSDVQRRGPEAVFRDGFANFLLLTQDFANRERALTESYDSALLALDRTGWLDGVRELSDATRDGDRPVAGSTPGTVNAR